MEQPERLVALMLGREDRGFTPGTTFAHGGCTWTREYVVPNSLRQASGSGPGGTYKVIEQDPRARGPQAALVLPGHAPHAGCDGKLPHEVFWVVQLTPLARFLGLVIDGRWVEFAKSPTSAMGGPR